LSRKKRQREREKEKEVEKRDIERNWKMIKKKAKLEEA